MSDIYKTLSKLLADLKPQDLTPEQADALSIAIDTLAEPITKLEQTIDSLESKKDAIDEEITEVESDLSDLLDLQMTAEGVLDLWQTSRGL